MSAKSDYTLRVPSGTTDEGLVKALKEVLPDLLVKKMNISREQAERGAEVLAERIVSKARQCNQVHLVPEVTNKIFLNAPSKDECEAFKTSLEELIVIRYGKGPMRRSKGEIAVGKLWSFLKYRVMGIDMQKEWEKEEMETPNAAIGHRG